MVACAAASLAGLFVLRGGGAPATERRLDLPEALRRYAAILRLRAARVLYLAVFIEGALVFGIFPFLAPLFVERGLAAGSGAAEAGLAVAFYAFGGFAFAALAPMLLRRLGQARMIVLGGATLAAGLLALGFMPVAWVGIGACLVLGLGFYMIHSSIQTRVTEVAPQARGTAVALHAFSFFLGQSLGPVLMGGMRAVLGPAGALVAAAAGMLALAIWLAPRGAKPAS